MYCSGKLWLCCKTTSTVKQSIHKKMIKRRIFFMNKNVTKITTGVATFAGIIAFGGATINANAATTAAPVSQSDHQTTDHQLNTLTAKHKLAHVASQHAIVQNSVNQAQDKVDSTTKEVTTATTNLTTTQKKQATAQKNADKAQKELLNATPEHLLTAKDNLDQAKEQVTKDTQNAQDIHQKLNDAKTAESNQKSVVTNSSVDLKQAQDKFNQAQTDFNTKNTAASKDKLSLAEITNKIDQLKNNISQSQSIVDKNTKIQNGIAAKIAKATTERNNAQTARDTQKGTLTQATTQQTKAKRDYDQAKQALDSATKSTPATKETNNNLDTLQANAIKTKKAYDDATQAVDQATTDLATAENKLKQAQANLDALKPKLNLFPIEPSQQDIANYNNQITALEKQQQEIKAANTAKETLATAQTELTAQENKLDAAKQNLADKTKQVNQLEENYEAAQALTLKDQQTVTERQNKLNDYSNASTALLAAQADEDAANQAVSAAKQAVKLATDALATAKTDLSHKKVSLAEVDEAMSAAEAELAANQTADNDSTPQPQPMLTGDFITTPNTVPTTVPTESDHSSATTLPEKLSVVNHSATVVPLKHGNHKQIILPATKKAKTLPQTSESTTTVTSLFGLMLVSLTATLGLLGLRRKRQN